MYGTVARFRAKPGNVDELVKLQKQFEADPPPGFVAVYIYQMDDDPEEFFEAVVFENRETYMAHADSPDSHQRYVEMRALLEADPEWHDGTVIHPSG
jgi:quinol monooxygenase YgiN